MKKKQNQWKKLMISLVLLWVAIILSVVLLPVWIIYTLWMILDRVFNPTSNSSWRKAIGYLANTIRSVAVGIDQIWNVICRDLFNNILIKWNGYKFWNIQETISSVLWRNEKDRTLTDLGWYIVKVLDKIEKDHCKKSIIYFK
jgi:hypothetical protein